MAVARAVFGGMSVFLVILEAAEWQRGVVGHVRIRIAQFTQVSGAWTDVEVTQDRVITILRLQEGNRARFVFNIAEDNRVDRANLLAGGFDRAVGNLNIIGRTGL